MTPRDYDAPVTPAVDDINHRIRALMGEPDHRVRGDEYARLLVLWAEASMTKAPHAGSDGEAPRHSPPAAVYVDTSHDTTHPEMTA